MSVSGRVVSLYQLPMHVVVELAVTFSIYHIAHEQFWGRQGHPGADFCWLLPRRCRCHLDATVLHFARPTQPTFLLGPVSSIYFSLSSFPPISTPQRSQVHRSHPIFTARTSYACSSLSPSSLPPRHRHVHDRAPAPLSISDPPRHPRRRGDPVHAPKPHCARKGQ